MNDFIFLANWYDIIKAYDDAGQSDMANAIAKEIIIYGTTGDTQTTDPLIYGIVRGLCTDQIKRPKSRVQSIANGKKGGRPPKYDKVTMIELHNQGLTDQEVADSMGCTLKTVQRALSDVDEI
jgi:DNA-directed RNA polymerase specialized sigma24 family protein